MSKLFTLLLVFTNILLFRVEVSASDIHAFLKRIEGEWVGSATTIRYNSGRQISRSTSEYQYVLSWQGGMWRNEIASCSGDAKERTCAKSLTLFRADDFQFVYFRVPGGQVARRARVTYLGPNRIDILEERRKGGKSWAYSERLEFLSANRIRVSAIVQINRSISTRVDAVLTRN